MKEAFEWKDIRDVKTDDIVLDGFGGRWATVSSSGRSVTYWELRMFSCDNASVEAAIWFTLKDGGKLPICVEKK